MRKSQRRDRLAFDYGTYELVDADTGTVVYGELPEAGVTLDQGREVPDPRHIQERRRTGRAARRVMHSQRFRKVSNRYPRRVAEVGADRR